MLQNSYEVQTVNHLKEIIQPYPFHILSDKRRGEENALWRFRQCFFFIFCRQLTVVANIFTQLFKDIICLFFS